MHLFSWTLFWDSACFASLWVSVVCLSVLVLFFLNAYICLSWFGVKPLMSRPCTFSLACLPICVHSMCLYSLVCIPCSCSTSLISLHHLSCVFSHVFFIHACLPPCPEAVSSMVWRRIETGMGCLELGRTTNLGQRVFFSPNIPAIYIYICYVLYQGHSRRNKVWTPYEYIALLLALHTFL